MSNPRSRRPSFEEVATDLESPLRRYLERMVGNPVDADDLLQETLIRIARGLSDFEGRSQLKTWAFRIAYRVVIDHFRQPAHRRNVVEFSEQEVSDAEREPGDELIIDEMNSCVREVIESLPHDYRAAIVLHDLQGLSTEETAEVCDCSVAAAKIRIHRGRKRLKEALSKECQFYYDREQVLRCDRKGHQESK